MASTVLTKTSTTVTDDKKFTISTWVKRSALSNSNIYGLLGHKDSANSGNSNLQLYFNADWLYFAFRSNNGADTHIQYVTNQYFRDTSAWYHIVASVDSTQATASDRVTMWLNGEEITSFQTETNPPLNRTFLNASSDIYVGKVVGTTGTDYYFDGLQAHTHYCDGYAYSASDFGETDSTTGIWKPKTSPSVNYGNNGFFLKYENSGAFGTDSSGNGNNFTVNGTMTQTIDTPSNVFCTMSPLTSTQNFNLSNGNLKLGAAADNQAIAGTLAGTVDNATYGYYFEYKVNASNLGSGGEGFRVGILNANDIMKTSASARVLQGVQSDLIYETATNGGSGVVDTDIGSMANGDIVMVAWKNGKVWFGVNGTWVNSGNPSAGTGEQFSGLSGDYVPWIMCSLTNGVNGSSFNFGNGYFGTTAVSSGNADDNGLGVFEYAPPTNFLSLCTKNMNEVEYS